MASPSHYTYTAESNAVSVQHILDAGGIFIGKVNHDQLATELSGCRSPCGNTPQLLQQRPHPERLLIQLRSLRSRRPGLLQPRNRHRRLRPRPRHPHPRHHHRHGTDRLRGPHHVAHHRQARPARRLLQARPHVADLARRLPRAARGRLVQHVDYTIFKRAGTLLYDASMLYDRMTCIGEFFPKDNINDLHPVIRKLFLRALVNPPTAWDVFRDQALQVELTRKVQLAFDTLQGEGLESTGVDVLIVPTTTRHSTIVEMERDPLELNAQLGMFTHCANVVDLDGKSGVELPFGVTILSGSGRDAKVLDVAAVIEKALGALRRDAAEEM